MTSKQDASVLSAHSLEGVEPREAIPVAGARDDPKLPARPGGEQRPPLELDGFSSVVLKPGPRGGSTPALLPEVYRCWKAVWMKTFAELMGAERVFSDDFTRQHEYIALFHEGRCIGLSTFRYVDLDSEFTRDDSYFKVWPEQALTSARAWGRSACIVSNLTVAEDYRGRVGGLSFKELVTLLSMQRLSTSSAHMALVTTRNDRGMNDVMYRFGAHRLAQDVVLHGVSVDLVLFSRQEVGGALSHPRLAELVRRLTSGETQRRSA
jgi:hypothetical protein